LYKPSDFSKDFYRTGEVAKILKVTPITVARYEEAGYIKFDRTETNRRVISREGLIDYFRRRGLLVEESIRKDVVYTRVSTRKESERGDLDRQIEKVLAYACTCNPVDIEVVKEVGSGLNDNRKGLLKLIVSVMNDEIGRIFIHHKDRLTRFGFRYIETVCKTKGTEIVIVSNEVTEKSVQEELAEDLCSIIHSFSGKLYGMRRTQKSKIDKEVNALFGGDTDYSS